jgi:outer membrane protein, multidrug efflux system
MMICRNLAICLLVPLIVGCSLGPDYVRPSKAKMNLAADVIGFTETNSAIATGTDVPREWWHLYNDTVLDGLVQTALRENRDLKIAAANVRRADAFLTVTEDKKRPQLAVAASVDYGELSAEEHLQFGSSLPSDFLYNIEGALSYQLDLFGQIQRAIEVANADAAASRAAYDAVKIGIVAETTRAYLDVCVSGRESVIAEKIAAVQRRMTAVNDRMIAAGRALPTSHALFAVQQDRLHAAIPVLQARQTAAAYRLAALLGAAPAEFPASVAMCRQPPAIRAQLPTGDGRAFLRRRPDIRQAEDQLRAATAEIGVVTAELYPKISLGLAAGSTGLAGNVLNRDTYKYSFGPLIAWQLPNRTAAKARILQAEAQNDAAYANFDNRVLIALRDVETALATYARDIDRNGDLHRAKLDRARSLNDATRLRTLGRGTLGDVLAAERDDLQAEQELAASDGQLLADQVGLFHVLGGGW